jgi:CCR4-NOT transcriptional regulation complex NOT5 subunit
MKLNKLTHFMIIVFFAVTFIVVYLYYTIKDVKKISTEVQKLSKDVLTLSQSISSITSTLLTQAPMCYAPPSTNGVVETVTGSPTIQVTVQAEGVDDEASSETADDLHKIIETIDDEAQDTKDNVDILQLAEPTDGESPSATTAEAHQESDSRLDAKTLKNMPYEAIKKYCKEHGIDAKGTKEVLIGKILAS